MESPKGRRRVLLQMIAGMVAAPTASWVRSRYLAQPEHFEPAIRSRTEHLDPLSRDELRGALIDFQLLSSRDLMHRYQVFYPLYSEGTELVQRVQAIFDYCTDAVGSDTFSELKQFLPNRVVGFPAIAAAHGLALVDSPQDVDELSSVIAETNRNARTVLGNNARNASIDMVWQSLIVALTRSPHSWSSLLVSDEVITEAVEVVRLYLNEGIDSYLLTAMVAWQFLTTYRNALLFRGDRVRSSHIDRILKNLLNTKNHEAALFDAFNIEMRGSSSWSSNLPQLTEALYVGAQEGQRHNSYSVYARLNNTYHHYHVSTDDELRYSANRGERAEVEFRLNQSLSILAAARVTRSDIDRSIAFAGRVGVDVPGDFVDFSKYVSDLIDAGDIAVPEQEVVDVLDAQNHAPFYKDTEEYKMDYGLNNEPVINFDEVFKNINFDDLTHVIAANTVRSVLSSQPDAPDPSVVNSMAEDALSSLPEKALTSVEQSWVRLDDTPSIDRQRRLRSTTSIRAPKRSVTVPGGGALSTKGRVDMPESTLSPSRNLSEADALIEDLDAAVKVRPLHILHEPAGPELSASQRRLIDELDSVEKVSDLGHGAEHGLSKGLTEQEVSSAGIPNSRSTRKVNMDRFSSIRSLLSRRAKSVQDEAEKSRLDTLAQFITRRDEE